MAFDGETPSKDNLRDGINFEMVENPQKIWPVQNMLVLNYYIRMWASCTYVCNKVEQLS